MSVSNTISCFCVAFISFLFLCPEFSPYTCKFSQILTTNPPIHHCSKPPEPKAAAPADDGGKEDTRMNKLRSDKVAQRGRRGRPESPTSGKRYGGLWNSIWMQQLENHGDSVSVSIFWKKKNLRVGFLENRWAAKLKILY